MLFVGDDWAEEHHDVELQDETGRRLGKARMEEGVAGIAKLHELIGRHVTEDAAADQVVIGIETDRGPWVQALIAAGYQVYAVNPLSVARYRERHSVSGAKSDAADARTLADMVRTDRHQHRVIAGDTPQGEAIKVVARAHKTLVWERTRHVQRLRHALREYFPRGSGRPPTAGPAALNQPAVPGPHRHPRQITSAHHHGEPQPCRPQRSRPV
ncbi:transposase [Streptosporangium lutulentum]|uniref:Transposase n=1 Tax=Streptosporangium lutulentum TaxID=1461250 RepID=A0ABT9QJR2_9ACTN|nr:transposase [Streptosporangium lutulentum]